MKKLLVIKPSSFGDIIHGLQVVQSIKEEMPGLEVTWVVRDIFSSFVASCTTVDKLIVFKRKGGALSFIKCLKEIRAESYDAVLDLQGLLRSGIMTWAARSPLKIGRSDAREGAGLFYGQKMSKPQKSMHAVDILRQCLPLLGFSLEIKGKLQFEDLKLSSYISETFSFLDKPLVLLFPNSRRAEKEWPYFPELTEQLLARYPSHYFAWVGQDPLGSSLTHPHFFNLLGKTSMPEMIHLMQMSSLNISNDSGPMHLAAALKKPVLGLFGPTSPKLYGPYPLSSKGNQALSSPTKEISTLGIDLVLQAAGDFL